MTSAAGTLQPGEYGFDEVEIGACIDTGDITVDAALIDRFAEISGDRFEIHMSRQAAQRYGFPDRVAHGLLVLSLIDGLKNTAPARFRAIASLGWTWSFQAPTLVGDTLRARITVQDKRTTQKPDRGILTLGFSVTNQRGKVVQAGHNQLMVYR